ncbi:hypothetical protein H6P81_011962 [Aristolochia fimbriata]|uniref:Uncharacterized protein n=1 Tax=Aristolochia fimbriata TaxID=158543 RepID=A0AAV7EAU5_ARIFI|nr:hypothetical protein H6P81_011962 [Aristolochia fimbriata]
MASENAPQIDSENPTGTMGGHLIKIQVGRLQELLDSPAEAKQWDRCCIYRVPPHLCRLNKELFRPTLVSTGPYHHGEPHLKPMEEHKFRAMRQFLERSGRTLSDLKRALEDDVSKLMDSYEELDAEWSEEAKFLELMILDGCFILEFNRVSNIPTAGGYSDSDPVFGIYGACTRSKPLFLDILLLENQVPFLLLEKLLAIENRITVDAVQYLDDFFPVFPRVYELYKEEKPAHLLDLFRTKIIGRLSRKSPPNFAVLETKPASAYSKAGIEFRESHTATISGFKLENNVLELPTYPLHIEETMRANLEVYETLHGLGGLEIHSYFRIMGGLLQSVEDVRLLGIDSSIQAEMIVNSLKVLHDGIGSFAEVESDLVPVVLRLNRYYRESGDRWKRRIREWGCNLRETYFKNPWTVMSLLGALLVISFTVVQTVFTTLSYYNIRG